MSRTVSDEPLNLNELEGLAKKKLSQMAYDYYSSGAMDEITLFENIACYQRLRLLPRMLVDVSNRDMATEVLGTKMSIPVMVSPTAFHGLAHPDAETATAKAAGKAGVCMVQSTLSNCSIEEVAAAATGPLWFQLYVYKDRGITKNLLSRAKEAGFKAVVVTVDSPRLGRRERDERNNFTLPDTLSLKNLAALKLDKFPNDKGSGLRAYIASLYDPALTWYDFEWIVSESPLPVLVKGVLRADDALKAIRHGANGIVVSNHGGRQLDTAVSAIEALPAIVEAVADEVPVLIDGGIRRGTDIMKAIALGAKAVGIGRPVLWGLALNGADGVEMVLNMIRAELDLAMTLAGCSDIASITRDLVQKI